MAQARPTATLPLILPSGANAANDAWPRFRNCLQDGWDERTKIRNPIGLRADQDDRHADGLEVLLIGQVLIHGDEDIELAPGSAQQLAILKTSPAARAHRLDVMAR